MNVVNYKLNKKDRLNQLCPKEKKKKKRNDF